LCCTEHRGMSFYRIRESDWWWVAVGMEEYADDMRFGTWPPFWMRPSSGWVGTQAGMEAWAPKISYLSPLHMTYCIYYPEAQISSFLQILLPARWTTLHVHNNAGFILTAMKTLNLAEHNTAFPSSSTTIWCTKWDRLWAKKWRTVTSCANSRQWNTSRHWVSKVASKCDAIKLFFLLALFNVFTKF
jgi:hypothetical protein